MAIENDVAAAEGTIWGEWSGHFGGFWASLYCPCPRHRWLGICGQFTSSLKLWRASLGGIKCRRRPMLIYPLARRRE